MKHKLFWSDEFLKRLRIDKNGDNYHLDAHTSTYSILDLYYYLKSGMNNNESGKIIKN